MWLWDEVASVAQSVACLVVARKVTEFDTQLRRLVLPKKLVMRNRIIKIATNFLSKNQATKLGIELATFRATANLLRHHVGGCVLGLLRPRRPILKLSDGIQIKSLPH